MWNIGYVYLIWNKNLNIKNQNYVGCCLDEKTIIGRFSSHLFQAFYLKHNDIFHKFIRDYGFYEFINDFKIEMLDELKYDDKKELYKLETYFMKKYDWVENGFNSHYSYLWKKEKKDKIKQYYKDNKNNFKQKYEQNKDYYKKYYVDNKQKIIEYQKKNYKDKKNEKNIIFKNCENITIIKNQFN